jgi:hypothetical protein
MAGVASMAVAINPADKSLIVVIEHLLWMQRAKDVWLLQLERGSGVRPKHGRETSLSQLKPALEF